MDCSRIIGIGRGAAAVLPQPASHRSGHHATARAAPNCSAPRHIVAYAHKCTVPEAPCSRAGVHGFKPEAGPASGDGVGGSCGGTPTPTTMYDHVAGSAVGAAAGTAAVAATLAHSIAVTSPLGAAALTAGVERVHAYCAELTWQVYTHTSPSARPFLKNDTCGKPCAHGLSALLYMRISMHAYMGMQASWSGTFI